jgi:hypothetical protein
MVAKEEQSWYVIRFMHLSSLDLITVQWVGERIGGNDLTYPKTVRMRSELPAFFKGKNHIQIADVLTDISRSIREKTNNESTLESE